MRNILKSPKRLRLFIEAGMLDPHGSALFQRLAEMGVTERQIQTQRLAKTQKGPALTITLSVATDSKIVE